MRVCVIQMNSVNDKAANLAQAGSLIERAVAQDRPDLVLLPEVWSFQGGTAEERQAAAEAYPTIALGEDFHAFQPRLELRRGPEAEHLARVERVVE